MGALFMADNYGLGAAGTPGPGFFPMIVGGLLTIFGFTLLANSLMHRAEPADKVTSWQFLPALLILGSVVVFALLMKKGQFLLAITALVFISSLSRGRLSLAELVEVGLLTIVLCILSVGVFIYGLGMPFSMW
jgi:hypothetical protein